MEDGVGSDLSENDTLQYQLLLVLYKDIDNLKIKQTNQRYPIIKIYNIVNRYLVQQF